MINSSHENIRIREIKTISSQLHGFSQTFYVWFPNSMAFPGLPWLYEPSMGHFKQTSILKKTHLKHLELFLTMALADHRCWFPIRHQSLLHECLVMAKCWTLYFDRQTEVRDDTEPVNVKLGILYKAFFGRTGNKPNDSCYYRLDLHTDSFFVRRDVHVFLFVPYFLFPVLKGGEDEKKRNDEEEGEVERRRETQHDATVTPTHLSSCRICYPFVSYPFLHFFHLPPPTHLSDVV